MSDPTKKSFHNQSHRIQPLLLPNHQCWLNEDNAATLHLRSTMTDPLLVLERWALVGLATGFLVRPELIYHQFFFMTNDAAFPLRFCMNIIGVFMLGLVYLLHSFAPTSPETFRRFFVYLHFALCCVWWRTTQDDMMDAASNQELLYKPAFVIFPVYHFTMLVIHIGNTLWNSKNDHRKNHTKKER